MKNDILGTNLGLLLNTPAMRKKYFLICTLFPLLFSAQSWEWANGYGTTNPVLVHHGVSISRDNKNNLYTTGFTWAPKSGPNNGWAYTWLKKFDARGNIIWTDTIPFASNTKNLTDANGNTYVVGNGKLIKYATDGSQVWYQNTPFGSIFELKFIFNDLIVIGFNGGNTSSIGTTSIPAENGFIAKCDVNGNWIWAKAIQGYGPQAMSITANNLIYTQGSNQQGVSDATVIKIFDQNGNYIKGLLNTKHITPYISTDSKNNFYIVVGISDYAPLIINTDTIRCNCGNATNRVLIKFDDNGNYKWHKLIKKDIDVIKVVCDEEDNVYISGNILNTLQIDSFLLDNHVSSIYVAKFKSDGEVAWIKYSEQPSPNVGYGQVNDMILDSENNPMITGSITDKHIFGNITLTGHDNLYSDLMIAKIKQDKVIGVNETPFLISNNLNVYPNPTDGLFTAYYRSEKSSALTLKIINQLGQVILVKNYPEQKEISETFDLSPFAKGIYLIQVKTNETTEVKKIILK
jgi:hypothetical protein